METQVVMLGIETMESPQKRKSDNDEPTKRARRKSSDEDSGLEISTNNSMDLTPVKNELGDTDDSHHESNDGSTTKPFGSLNGTKSVLVNGLSPTKGIKERRPMLVLEKLSVHEVLITIPSKNIREITYTGVDESNNNCGLHANGQKKLSEYRVEKCAALPTVKRENSDSPPNERKPVPVFLQLVPDMTSLFSLNGYHDDLHSVLDVLSGQKMSTTVLDAFLSRRIILHNTLSSSEVESPKAIKPPHMTFEYLSLLFLPVYDRDQSLSTYVPNMNLFPSCSLKDSILIAPQYICKHYYLAVFNFPAKSVYVYDSCWNYVEMRYRFNQIRCVLKGLTGCTLGERGNKSETWDIYYVDKCAQQIDEVNCGCFVIYFAENELKGKSYKNEMKLNNRDLLQIRQQIIREILPSTIIGSQLLEAISM